MRFKTEKLKLDLAQFKKLKRVQNTIRFRTYEAQHEKSKQAK